MKKLLKTTLIALLSLTSYLNAEVIDNVIETVFYSPKVISEVKEYVAKSGSNLTYSWRKDGSLWQTTHPVLTIRFNEKEEVSYFYWREEGIIFEDEGESVKITDEVFNTSLNYKVIRKENVVFVHYWGTLEGTKVDTTFNYTESKVFINEKLNKYYKDALGIGEAAKKKAALLKEYYKKN